MNETADIETPFSCDSGYPDNPVVLHSKMRRIYETVDTIKEYDSNVLISGESGTGKSLLARHICKTSPRKGCPFIEVNCGSLNDQLLESELFGHTKGAFTGAIKSRPGKIETANTGTLFLDDINSASLAMQTKLLHVMENRCIQRVGENKTIHLDTRFICASNRNILLEVRSQRFREDLYYRIAVINLEIPPLRERKDEIIPLIEYFIRLFNEKYNKSFKGLLKSDQEKALCYDWPGNVRELKNAVERSFVLSKGVWVKLNLIDVCEPANSGPSMPLREAVSAYEKKYIYQTLTQLNWDIDTVSQKMGIGRSTLFNKIKKYDLKKVEL